MNGTEPATELTVHPVRDHEVAVVVALWEVCGLTRPWNDPMRDIAFARSGPNSDVLVGLAGGRLVASAMVGHDGHRGAVYYLSVLPELQGRGFGRVLMTAIEAWMRERGVWKINLLVREGNEAVLDFYDALGFEVEGSVQLGKWLEPKRGAPPPPPKLPRRG
ncbi:MAG: GNAT family acetyltransferase [Rhizobiales bacterium]|nr:GNAT family acetyltransferase [Hyphomicrobiales bacterium]